MAQFQNMYDKPLPSDGKPYTNPTVTVPWNTKGKSCSPASDLFHPPLLFPHFDDFEGESSAAEIRERFSWWTLKKSASKIYK